MYALICLDLLGVMGSGKEGMREGGLLTSYNLLTVLELSLIGFLFSPQSPSDCSVVVVVCVVWCGVVWWSVCVCVGVGERDGGGGGEEGGGGGESGKEERGGREGGESETFKVYLADPASQSGIRIYILIPSDELPLSFFCSFHFLFFFFPLCLFLFPFSCCLAWNCQPPHPEKARPTPTPRRKGQPPLLPTPRTKGATPKKGQPLSPQKGGRSPTARRKRQPPPQEKAGNDVQMFKS